MEMLLKTSQAADQLHVSAETMRRWQREGRITPAQTTPGGHARWSHVQVDELAQLVTAGVIPPIAKVHSVVSTHAATIVDPEIARSGQGPKEPNHKDRGDMPRVSHLASLVHSGHTPVIAVFSPKQGVGKTSLAVDIACFVAHQDPDIRVLIIEADTDGTLPFHFPLRAHSLPPYTYNGMHPLYYGLSGLLNHRYNDPDLDTAHMLGYMKPLNADPRVHVASSDDPDLWLDGPDDELGTLLELLAPQYDLVVIDCGCDVYEHIPLFKHVDLILSPYTNEVASVHTMRKAIKAMEQAGIDVGRRLVCLDARTPIDPRLAATKFLPREDVRVVTARPKLSAIQRKAGMPMVLNPGYAHDVAAILNPLPHGHIVKATDRLQPQSPRPVQTSKRGGFFALLKSLAS